MIFKQNTSRYLSRYRVLADECVNTDVVVGLRESGINVLTVREAGLTGTDDKTVFEFAFPDFKGHVFESAAFNELRGKNDEMFYWKRKNKELDFIRISTAGFHAYEIKQSDRVNFREKIKYEAYVKELQAVSFTMVNGWKKLMEL